jgi:hypothetical protein
LQPRFRVGASLEGYGKKENSNAADKRTEGSAEHLVFGTARGIRDFVCLAGFASFSRAVYRISKIYSTLEFSVTKWMVFKEEGLFHEFDRRIEYNSAHPENAVVE